ncbi:gas vesicle protein GvpG [Micromonospora sp. NPDC005806]|uniref:gas vesicle protein GvpG n=1 Tax=Micromonospora sp. NPDC005806 TaxID=3364234 RepID=UPI0036841012
MDILWGLLTLPYAPVRGLTVVLKVVAREAEWQQHNPVNIRRELEDLDRAAEAGEISPQERDRAQQQVLDRLTTPAAVPGRTPSRETGAGRRRQRPVRWRTAGRRGEQHRGRGR